MGPQEQAVSKLTASVPSFSMDFPYHMPLTLFAIQYSSPDQAHSRTIFQSLLDCNCFKVQERENSVEVMKKIVPILTVVLFSCFEI